LEIDNKYMLECFREKDEVFYYNSCKNIELAGDDYKIREIRYFIKDKADPLSDYVEIRIYDDEDGFISVYAATKDAGLLCEALQYLLKISEGVREISLRTPFAEIFSYKCVSDYFNVTETECPVNPVYYVHRADELIGLPENKDVQVNPVTEKDKLDVKEAEAAGHLDPESFNSEIFDYCGFYKDTKFFILRVKGKIAGYLRAENGFSNIYDIGWVYVLPEYRGHGYAAYLVLFFSDYCFEKGFIPQYGYAINHESIKVAKKCGYKCDPQTIYAKALEKR